jgi:3-oxoacyl-[acyl-carrier protein] reductase
MDLGLSGRPALVLGSTSGLGLATGRQLAREGAKVAFCGRREQLAKDAAGEFDHCLGVPLDLSDPRSVASAITACREALGPPDIVVLNSGGPPAGFASQVAVGPLLGNLETMLFAQLRVVEEVLPAMLARRWGRIAAIGSSGVRRPIPHLAQSNMARAALAAYLKSLAHETAGRGVTVNMINPGRIDTSRVAELDAAAAAGSQRPLSAVREESQAGIPAGRYGRSSEFADVVTFICSERASYVTGTQIDVDGGMSRSL